MTAEHLKPIPGNTKSTELFCQVGEHLARGKIPGDVLLVVRMGRTAPFYCALTTRAGFECMAHVLQALTDTDPRATIPSVYGISAYDSISRVAEWKAAMHSCPS